MLNLARLTNDQWFPRVAGDVPALLLDHAHCEKKAASTAMSLIFRYQQHVALMEPLSALAREELEHFELVLGILKDRGIDFERQEPSPYAAELMKAVRRTEPDKLLDTLIACGLIEARSCERMQILAEQLEDEELRRLYQGLLASEARHHGTYLRLAEIFFTKDEVRTRLVELAEHEADVIDAAPSWSRMHT